jgi:hypothetical protein
VWILWGVRWGREVFVHFDTDTEGLKLQKTFKDVDGDGDGLKIR